MPATAHQLPPCKSLAIDQHAALPELRARAEARCQLVTQVIENRTPDEVQRLVQELQVHQIELEMQNEELLLAQAEAQAARAQYVDLYDFAPVGYFSLTAPGLIEQLNFCGSKLLGTVRQRLVGRRFALFVSPASRLDFGQFLARVLSTDTTQSCELQLQRDDETPFYGHLEGLRVDTATGPQCRLVVVDTTASQQATQALAASEARFRKLFAESSDAVTLLQGHQFVDCNAAALRLLGARHRDQLVGHAAWAHTPEMQPDGRRTIDLFRETVADALRLGSKRCVAMMHRLSGEAFWVEGLLTPIELGGPTPVIHIVWRDITAARTAEQELRTSRERLQLALAAAETGVYNWDLATGLMQGDARFWAAFGYANAPAGMRIDNLAAAFHPDDASRLQDVMTAAIASDSAVTADYRVVWPDGTVRYVSSAGHMVRDAHGQPLAVAGVLRDVTQDHEAEAALRQQKEFTESLLESSVDGILAYDRNLRMTAWNATAAQYFGLPAAAVLGRPLAEVLPYLDAEAYRLIGLVLAGTRQDRLHQPFRSRPGHYDAHLVPLMDHDSAEPSGVLVIVRDVTERDRLAEEDTQLRLRQQQEVLAAILATQESERKRIAEAIHNGLGQLLYATKLSLERTGETDRREGPLKLLDEAIRTTRTISFELTPGILEDFGLRIALETLVKRLNPSPLPVRLHCSGLDARLPAPVEITVYRTVQELLNNVMKHAQATEVELHVALEDGRLFVSVEDNGHGFEPDLLGVQPLVGIGLAGVRNRVALLGGQLSVSSRLGQGTIVSFELDI